MQLKVSIAELAELAREIRKEDPILSDIEEVYDLMSSHVIEWVDQSEDPLLVLAATCVHLLVENHWLHYERLDE